MPTPCHRNRPSILALLGFSILICLPRVAGAEDLPSPEWSARITPYGWLPRIDGKLRAGKQTESFSVSIKDVLSAFSGGGMLNAEFRWHRLVLLGDLVASRLSSDSTTRSTTVDLPGPLPPLQIGGIDLESTVFQLSVGLGLGYRLLDRPFPGLDDAADPRDPRRLSLVAYLGARYWNTQQETKLKLPPILIAGVPVPGTGRKVSIDFHEWWVDPHVGVLLEMRPWQAFSFALEGSVGGFGIGSASDFAWAGTLSGSWHFAERWSLDLAYKGLGFQRDFGSGSDTGSLDTAIHGPAIGFSYRF